MLHTTKLCYGIAYGRDGLMATLAGVQYTTTTKGNESADKSRADAGSSIEI